MKTWHYNRTDTMPINYTIIMIRAAEQNFLQNTQTGIW